LGAWPVFVFARRALGDERLAAGCAALWLLQPALSYVGLFEFHPEALAVPALLGMVAWCDAGRAGGCLLCAGIALSAKEDVALAVLTFGALTLVTRDPGRRRIGAILIGLALVFLLVSFAVLKPAFGEKT